MGEIKVVDMKLVCGKVKSGKTMQAIKKAVELSTVDGKERQIYMVMSEHNIKTESYKKALKETLGVELPATVKVADRIMDIIFYNKEYGGVIEPNSILVLEDYELVEEYSKHGRISNVVMDCLIQFESIIVPVQTGLDGLMNYHTKSFLVELYRLLGLETVEYHVVKRDWETGKPTIVETYEHGF